MHGKAKQSWYLKSSLITNDYSLGEARRKSVASSIVGAVIYGLSKFYKYTHFSHTKNLIASSLLMIWCLLFFQILNNFTIITIGLVYC